MPPPDAPIPGDAPGGEPGGTASAEASEPKRRFLIGAAALAVVVSAIATFAVVSNNHDSDNDNTSAKTTTSSQSVDGQSSTSGPQPSASGGTTTTTGSGVTSSTVPGSTGPRPTDPITKLPIATTSTTTKSTPTGATTTPTTGSGPSGDELDAAYLSAYLAECTKIWSHSTNGLLYDPDDPEDSYTITTCTESADAAFRTSADTLAAAKKLGVEDAIWFSSLNTSSGQMCWLDTANDTLLACWDPENPNVPTTPTTS